MGVWRAEPATHPPNHPKRAACAGLYEGENDFEIALAFAESREANRKETVIFAGLIVMDW